MDNKELKKKQLPKVTFVLFDSINEFIVNVKKNQRVSEYKP